MGLFSKTEVKQPFRPPELTHIISIYKDEAGEWRSRIKSVNGNIIADSGEGYKNALDCRAALHNLVAALQNRTYRVEEDGQE